MSENYIHLGGGIEDIPDDAPDWIFKAIEEGILYEVYDLGMICMEYLNKNRKATFLECHKAYNEQDFYWEEEN